MPKSPILWVLALVLTAPIACSNDISSLQTIPIPSDAPDATDVNAPEIDDEGDVQDDTVDDMECSPELIQCGQQCVNTQLNIQHCGECDNGCLPGAGSLAGCVDGQCSFVCAEGFEDLDGDLSMGGDCECEVGQEICDGVDNDCDENIDEGLINDCGGCQPLEGALGDTCEQGPCLGELTCSGTNALICETAFRVYHKDEDGDGLGDNNNTIESCIPQGFFTALDGGDCDDTDPNTYTGADELCDGKDNDCNDDIDEGVTDACGGCSGNNAQVGASCGEDECPGTVACSDTTLFCQGDNIEINGCGGCNRLDNQPNTPCGECGTYQCNGLNAVTCTNDFPQQFFHADNDRDGFGDDGRRSRQCEPDDIFVTTQDGDCDDTNPAIFPGANEVCDDKDNNCDGSTDETGAEASCPPQINAEAQCAAGQCAYACQPDFVDTNDDLQNEQSDGCDCGPIQPEICDGQDNNCNGDIDEGVVLACPLSDGVCQGAEASCTNGAFDDCTEDDYVQNTTDLFEPVFEVVCDTLDNNCDGAADENCCLGEDINRGRIDVSPPGQLPLPSTPYPIVHPDNQNITVVWRNSSNRDVNEDNSIVLSAARYDRQGQPQAPSTLFEPGEDLTGRHMLVRHNGQVLLLYKTIDEALKAMVLANDWTSLANLTPTTLIGQNVIDFGATVHPDGRLLISAIERTQEKRRLQLYAFNADRLEISSLTVMPELGSASNLTTIASNSQRIMITARLASDIRVFVLNNELETDFLPQAVVPITNTLRRYEATLLSDNSAMLAYLEIPTPPERPHPVKVRLLTANNQLGNVINATPNANNHKGMTLLSNGDRALLIWATGNDVNGIPIRPNEEPILGGVIPLQEDLQVLADSLKVTPAPSRRQTEINWFSMATVDGTDMMDRGVRLRLFNANAKPLCFAP